MMLNRHLSDENTWDLMEISPLAVMKASEMDFITCFFLPDQEFCPFFQTGLSRSVLQKMVLLNCTFPKMWDIQATPTVNRRHNNPGTKKSSEEKRLKPPRKQFNFLLIVHTP